jgi:hypothetical protein
VIVTQNDEEDRETLALLKILALGNDEVARGETRPAATVFADLRKRPARRRALSPSGWDITSS